MSWIRYQGRSAGLAAAVEADNHFVAYGRQGDRWLVPARYAAQTLATVALLARRRPGELWLMAPPLALAAIGVAYRLLTGATVVVDAHTGAVLSMRTGRVKRSFVAVGRRADAVVVTTRALAARLAAHGLDAVVLDDPPFDAPNLVAPPAGRFTCVLPAGWAPDEPIDTLVEAARLVPDVDVVVTGRPRRPLPERPTNLRLTGHLDASDYQRLLAGAGAVLALTTREHTMQRAGYEALAFGRPLVATGTAALRDYFTGGTVFVDNDAEGLAAGIRRCQAEAGELAAAMARLRDEKRREFDARLGLVRAQLAAGR